MAEEKKAVEAKKFDEQKFIERKLKYINNMLFTRKLRIYHSFKVHRFTQIPILVIFGVVALKFLDYVNRLLIE